MSYKESEKPQVTAVAQAAEGGFTQWLEDPMGSVIASSAAVIGSFGLVLLGTWSIHVILN